MQARVKRIQINRSPKPLMKLLNLMRKPLLVQTKVQRPTPKLRLETPTATTMTSILMMLMVKKKKKTLQLKQSQKSKETARLRWLQRSLLLLTSRNSMIVLPT